MSRPARRAAGALTAALLALLPLSGTLGSGAASAADIAPPPGLVVVLAGISPAAPQPGQDLTLTGRVDNPTSTAISDITVQPRISGPVTTRSDFDDYADDATGEVSTSSLVSIGSALPLAPTRLAAGASEPFQITLTADQLSALPAGVWQVRELALVATGTNPDRLLESGTLRSFLPWAPRTAVGQGKPIQLAWIWPLVDRPHRAVSSTWLDDALAPELSGQGRLARLLAAGSAAAHPVAPPRRRHHHHRKPAARAVPVTWAVDPLLVQDATLMSKGYTTQAPDGHPATGHGRAAATSWLAALRAGVAGSDVLSLPYADPDRVAAVRANLAGEVGVATAAGRELLAPDLSASSTLVQTAWPDNGFADERTLGTMFSTGITSVVLSSDALPIVGGQPSETPSARTPDLTGNGELNTILFDAGITANVDQGATNGADSPLELQRYLAETLMIQLEAPSDPRSVVVAPARRWQPSASYATDLLTETSQAPWLSPVPLTTVLSDPPYTRVTRGPLSYPSSARRAELRPSYLRQVRKLKNELIGFGTVLTSGTATVSSYDAALQRLLSSAYRSDVAAQDTALNSVRGSLESQMSRVHITTQSGSYITLTSHDGRVPITISNDLDTPVHVVLKVDANQRLGLANGGLKSETIPANTQFPITVRAVAKTSGVFPLEVRLLTPDLRPYGASVQLYVRSTAYGTITLVITAAATIALLIAVAIRLTRRALASRRAGTAEA